MPVILPFTHQTRCEHLRLQSMIRMILFVEGYERVSFSTSEVAHVYSFPDGKREAVERRPRERENEIASHAYEVDG